MLVECALLDGDTAPPKNHPIDNIETDTMAAVDNFGRIAAFSWLSLNSNHDVATVTVEGRVHPDYRRKGVGRYLLVWSEARAQEMLRPYAALSCGLVIAYYDRADDAPPLYVACGFGHTLTMTTYGVSLSGEMLGKRRQLMIYAKSLAVESDT